MTAKEIRDAINTLQQNIKESTKDLSSKEAETVSRIVIMGLGLVWRLSWWPN